MTRSTSLLSTLVLGILLALSPVDAEAKRLGGGKSFGKSYSTPKQSPYTSTTQQQQTTTTSKPKSSLGGKGMLAGLLAGGLLGALFFGGAFEGLQIMDMLVMALIAFIAFRLIRQFSAGRQPATVQGPQNWQQRAQPEVSPIPTQGGFGGTCAHPAGADLPPDFNLTQFLEEAKGHYQQLQQIWDQKDYTALASYVSPELLQALKAEREQCPGNNRTEVVSVQTELLRAERIGDDASLSIRFHGWIREDQDDVTGFNEAWHLQRPWNQPGNWVIVGIQSLDD